MSTLFLLLAACTPETKPQETGEEFLAPMAPAFVGVYAAASPGTFRTDCIIQMELYEGDTQVAMSQMLAVGGEWTGVLLPGTAVYDGWAIWDSCTTGPEGTGEFESSGFSGAEGDFFVFRYTGVTAAFDVLKQREDFVGGVALVSFAADITTDEEVQEMAAEHGVTATVEDGFQYRLTWEDTKTVGEVLTAFSLEREYESGQPEWVRPPQWW